jgi:heme A synthase
MKNPVIFYAAIVLGVVGLAAGVYFLVSGGHHTLPYAALGAGAILLIGGVVGMFMARSNAAAK